MSHLTFPKEFLWGAATSPTQVEGKVVNEWSAFTARDGNGPDVGGNHWDHFEDDAVRLPLMHLNSYRLGLDWGRLQHGPYHDLDVTALARYKEMLGCLQALGVRPMITLFHFACPCWLSARGGWLAKDAPKFFADFVDKLLDAGIRAEYWITINEPGVYVTMAYLLGLFPPHGRFQVLRARKALARMVEGHLYAYRQIHARIPEAKVGIAKHVKRIIPNRSWHPLDWFNAAAIQHIFCQRILEIFTRFDGECVADFIGMNFYGKLRIHGFRDISPISGDPAGVLEKVGATCDDMWEQDAGWLPECARDLQTRWELPIQITECGFATDDETLRCRLLLDHLMAIAEAIHQGVKIEGFYYWSLVDNFEWAEGMEKRFGLLGVDFTQPKMPRTLRPAGRLLSAVAEAGAIPTDYHTLFESATATV